MGSNARSPFRSRTAQLTRPPFGSGPVATLVPHGVRNRQSYGNRIDLNAQLFIVDYLMYIDSMATNDGVISTPLDANKRRRASR